MYIYNGVYCSVAIVHTSHETLIRAGDNRLSVVYYITLSVPTAEPVGYIVLADAESDLKLWLGHLLLTCNQACFLAKKKIFV
jgi:hypothetical protein